MAVRKQEFKPQVGSLEQLINNMKGDGLAGLIETINPNIANKPDYQKLKSFGKGTADFLMDPLNLIGGAGAGVKGATILSDIPIALYNRFNDVTRQLEKVRLAIKRETKNSATEDNAKTLARLKREEARLVGQEKIINTDIVKETGHDLLGIEAARKAKNTGILSAKTETGLDLSLPPAPPPAPMVNTKEGILSAIKEPSSLFHGSQTTGIKSLKLPEGYGSEGGVYLADKFNDPRIKIFTEGKISKGRPGSAYITRPNFNNVLDVSNTPKQVDKTLRNLQIDFLNRPTTRFESGTTRFKTTEPAYQVSQIRRGTAAPTFFDKEVGQGIMDLGFDAIKFPTANLGRLASKNYGNTVISLDPKNTLDILEEVPYDDIDEFIRLLTK